MMKAVTIAAFATLALAVTVAPQPAQARGGALAAGIIGGLAVGAIVGSQYNNGGYYGGPGYYQAPYQPVYGRCYYQREQFEDQYGRMHSRRIRVCD
jgi:hypothetical protein